MPLYAPRKSPHSRTTSRLGLALTFALALVLPAAAGAQDSADVVRGRVTDDSAHALIASVIVTRGPDRLVQRTSTDSSGAYTLRFVPGTGDYLVYVSAPGFTAARRRVQRQGTERELVANFSLTRDVTQLDAVKVLAAKPVRATNNVRPTQPETGASESWKNGVNGQIPPSMAGNLNAVAGTMSNITVTGAGPSVLGSGAESNLTTLNGMGLAAGSLPRAARTEARVTGATFDPTRGGFAGANIDVRLGPGDRFFQHRSGFLTIEPSQMQLTDATGRALGARTGSVRGSLGADGEIVRDALTYNVAIDVAHSVSDPATLLNGNTDLFRRAGVAADSVSRLVSVAGPLGVALAGHGEPTSQTHDAVTWLGRFDDTRDTLATRALTTYAGVTRDGALGATLLTAPSAGAERRESTVGGQLTIGNYVGEGRRILNEMRLAASAVHTTVTPYESIPGASVLVRSPLEGASVGVASLMLGGSPYLATDDSRWTVEGSNETIWNVNGSKNHLKALVWGRADGLRGRAISNEFGNFSFNSLDDLAGGRAASYTRTLSQPDRSGTVWNAAAAIAHEWVPSRRFSLLYGARLEADGFASVPARDVALESSLGVRSDVAPSRLHVSPRAGFSYLYSRDRENGQGTNKTGVGTFYRSMFGVVRGGIGEFRDLLRPGLLAGANAATGLPDGTSLLSCVGAAVPAADWSLFASNPGAIPTQCVDGSGPLVERAPSVMLIDPSYDVPRSWRASLDWTTNMGPWLLHVAALGSYDLSQPGTRDVNFAGTPHFTLADEGGRPVYVSSNAIDAASGSVSPSEARLSPDFGRVAMRTSDLRGYGGQLTTTISPDVFKFRSDISLFTSLSYTLQSVRRQYRGFDGAAFGDPRLREWGPSNNDARHVLVLSGGFDTPKSGTITAFARFQSGLPFTPVVQGDVNGDGMGGDRAFIPDPSLTGDAQLAAQLRSLMSNGSASARKCVLAYLGEVAARNGCRAPWTSALNVQWRPPFPARWLGRVTPNVYFENVLGGVDQLLHGNDLHGWGAQPVMDPVLLVPHGFDAAAGRFRYDVNPRFADTRAANSVTRNPFRIVMDFSVDFSTDYDLQQLRRAVEPVRSAGGWARRSPDSLAAFYLSRTSDIHKMLLANSDSLFLTPAQTRALQHADSIYSARASALYAPLGEFLAAQGEPGKATLDSVLKTQKAYWKLFWEQPEVADSIVTPSQRELIPMFKNLVATPKQSREHSQWYFGYPVTLAPTASLPEPQRGGVRTTERN